jgi:hypothetical protein
LEYISPFPWTLNNTGNNWAHSAISVSQEMETLSIAFNDKIQFSFGITILGSMWLTILNPSDTHNNFFLVLLCIFSIP